VTGLAQALSDISDIVQECVKECELFKTKDMELAIANLYANIFMFLRRAMIWYLKNVGMAYWQRPSKTSTVISSHN
jgi:hypothetical protein